MPESVLEGTASAVTNKQLKRKSDGRNFTLYNVETDQGTFTTAKRELALEAHALVGKLARFHVKTEQRGDFTNYYLEAVEAVDGSAFPEQMPQPRQQPPGPSPGQPEAPVGDPAGPTDKDVYIFRQTAAKVAAALSSTPEEFWVNLDDLVVYFITGTRPVEFRRGDAQGEPQDVDIPF